MKSNGKCYICGTEFDVETDICPRCGWWYLGYEEDLQENEIEPFNTVSIEEAKRNYAKGLNIFGDRLKST